MSNAGVVASTAASIAAAERASRHLATSRDEESGPVAPRSPLESGRRTARIAGVLYLAIFVIAPFVYFYVPGELFRDDAATTAAEISSNSGLFRAAMIAETVIVGIEIALAGLLWQLFRLVGPGLALSSSLARGGEALIQAVNVMIAGAVLIAVERGGLAGVDRGDRAELIGFGVDVMQFGVMIWGLLFGLHLFLLGVLVRRSDLMPRWIGSLLLIASIGYLAQSYGHVVDTSLDGFFEGLVIVLSVPGELAFAGYLLVRGIRRPPAA